MRADCGRQLRPRRRVSGRLLAHACARARVPGCRTRCQRSRMNSRKERDTDASRAENRWGSSGAPGSGHAPAGSRRVAAAATDLRRAVRAGDGGGLWPLAAGHPPRGAGRAPGEQSSRVDHGRFRLRPHRRAGGSDQHVVAPGGARVCPGSLPGRRPRDAGRIPRGRLPGVTHRDCARSRPAATWTARCRSTTGAARVHCPRATSAGRGARL